VKFLPYFLAALLGALGFIFLAGAQGQTGRFIVGVILFLAAGGLVYLARVRPQTVERTTVQRIDLSGDVNLEEFRCRSCNAPLSKDEIEVKAGAIMVQCDHCGATYQVEEAPKW